MAQVATQSITVAGGQIIRSVRVDGGAVRSQGGPTSPTLIMPVTAQLDPTPADATIALLWLRARLTTEAAPNTPIGPPTTELLLHEYPVRSFPSGSAEHTIQLSFSLTAAEVEELERRRHALPGDAFALRLELDAVSAGLTTHNQIPHTAEAQAGEQALPWGYEYGMVTQLHPFWRTNIQPVPFNVEQSTWIRDVLPGLGYDQARLIEVRFPPPLPEHRSAAREWDKAQRALDERHYDDAVEECRDILAMWEKQLGATSKRRVAAVIAEQRRWAGDDARIAFIDGLWKATNDLVNAPHHPEGTDATQHFDAPDARLTLLLTAALSQYISGS
ncbi:MAG: hypothetical protein ACYDA6_04200 [Solirubrobacteraceae bacterium]